jgi:hypothetical protein
MSEKTRQDVIEIAHSKGFLIQLTPDANDLYVKNLVFRSSKFSASPLIIDKVVGMGGVSGDFKYLKVAVHPDCFVETLVQPEKGVDESINRQSKINRHHSSNYVGFPNQNSGKHEPFGKCYVVRDLRALEFLLGGLSQLKSQSFLV